MGKHYIPQFYLRGFDTNDRIWAHDRQNRQSFASTVKSIANENDIYSEETESYLANRIEEPALSAISKLRSHQHIAVDERIALAKYIVTLWKRVPEARERAFRKIPEIADEVHAKIVSKLDRVAAENPNIEDRVVELKNQAEKIIARHKAKPPPEIWHESLRLKSDSKVEASLLSMNWVFLFNKNHQFLTSDNPVFFFDLEGIGRTTSELSLPLSSSVALWATRSPIASGTFLSASPATVREINRRTVSNSTRFVYSATNDSWILPFVTKGDWELTRLKP